MGLKDKILGVKIDNLSREDILVRIETFLSEPRFHQIATVNPEFILEAQRNSDFKKVLDETDLNVADGVGISFAFLRFGKHLKVRLTGADLMLEILRMANEKNLNVFLAAKKDGLSTWRETKEAILKNYPNLKIFGDDYDINNISNPSIRPYKEVVSDDKFISDIVFCNFSAPFQELFLNSQKCDTIRLAMGVGGSFDFLTGKVRRAPVFMQRIGLEWFWRIFQKQDWESKKKRLKRIFQAVIVFPIRVIFNK